MNPEPEDLACLYVLGQLDADQRGLLGLRTTSNKSPS